ncbi:MAG: Gfo/Idh/MocA family oxidoreductase [Bryobacteraceae bacterium]|nr:Gfo/Idh/MocA family oxidoreductase [Bryobacterales bacterium]MEB2360567.1 Gfo/Idh/MocA family oxidoreductase [Bryobacterales bacterium]NUM99689.1 Gfo/Idh/MocA family oxidoreductase [Bryobacteraceae bacterium]
MPIANRRDFFSAMLQAAGVRDTKPIRAGIVGVGDRGSYHMDLLLGTDLVEIPAICDINPDYLYRAKRWIEQAGKPSPELYDRGKTDFERLCERSDLDLVVCATSWEWHAPVCIAAMKAGKHATTEVPAALTVDECWEMVEVSEKTRKHCVMLEQANYSRDGLLVLEMAQKGVFGQILATTGGYVHDLRLVKFDPEREPWRLQHSVDRNGNLYPTHPIGPMAWWMDINRGDKFEYLVSMSSKAVCLNEYASNYFGDRHPYAGMKMNQGDVNTSLLRTANGKLAVLYFDTNTPHPQTAEMRLDGSKGHYAGNIQQVFIEGRSPKEHVWEPLANYRSEFDPPIWKNLDPGKFKRARGHGGGETTPLMWARLLRALQRGVEPDMNVYDAVVWSVISPLTERSVAQGSRPTDFPDFTRGKWKNTPPIRLEPESA